MTTIYDQEPTLCQVRPGGRPSGRYGRGGNRYEPHYGYGDPIHHHRSMQGLASAAAADNQSRLGRSVAIAAAVAAIAAGAAVGAALFGDNSAPSTTAQPVVMVPGTDGTPAPTPETGPQTIYVPEGRSNTTVVVPPASAPSAPAPRGVPRVAAPAATASSAPAPAAPPRGPAAIPAPPAAPKVDVIVALPDITPPNNSPAPDQGAGQGDADKDGTGKGGTGQGGTGQGGAGQGGTGQGGTGQGGEEGKTGGAGGSADNPNPGTGTVDYGGSAADGGSATGPILTQNPIGCSLAGVRLC